MYNCPVITPIFVTNYKKILLTLYVKTKVGNSVISLNSQTLHKSNEVVMGRKGFTVDYYFMNNYVLSISYSVDYLIKHCKDFSCILQMHFLKIKWLGIKWSDKKVLYNTKSFHSLDEYCNNNITQLFKLYP